LPVARAAAALPSPPSRPSPGKVHLVYNALPNLLRALREGQQIADTDRAAVESAPEKNTPGATPVIAATMRLDAYPLTMDVSTMQRVSDAMFEFGLIKQPYRITSMTRPEPGMVG
jgi:hypothetical protein